MKWDGKMKDKVTHRVPNDTALWYLWFMKWLQAIIHYFYLASPLFVTLIILFKITKDIRM